LLIESPLIDKYPKFVKTLKNIDAVLKSESFKKASLILLCMRPFGKFAKPLLDELTRDENPKNKRNSKEVK